MGVENALPGSTAAQSRTTVTDPTALTLRASAAAISPDEATVMHSRPMPDSDAHHPWPGRPAWHRSAPHR